MLLCTMLEIVMCPPPERKAGQQPFLMPVRARFVRGYIPLGPTGIKVLIAKIEAYRTPWACIVNIVSVP